MCGIVGALNLKGDPVPQAWIRRMTDLIHHRGPDGEGYFFANTTTGASIVGRDAQHSISGGNLAFGHRRLSILELTALGAQPMRSGDGLAVITFNGEIYNHLEIRTELSRLGHTFQSRSDTETILEAYRQWGDSCVDHLNGMFAFAIWDAVERRVFLARDRYGVKPVYWYHDGTWFLFGSEIKTILAVPEVKRSVCAPALNEYFTFQNTLSELTMFEGIKLLPAGCCLSVDMNRGGAVRQRQFWDYKFGEDPVQGSTDEVAEQLHHHFSKAVERQLLSDVPIGSYLSGGMDSGSIVALASRKLGRMTTFTCGFDLSSASGLELGFDERADSERMANLFKTEHYEMVLHAGDMEHIMPELIWHLEDLRVGQCYPNYYVARLAGKFVKVCLSGAGGDELFAGYPWRYFHGVQGSSVQDYRQSYYQFWQRLVPDGEKSELFSPEISAKLHGHSAFDVFNDVLNRFDRPVNSAEDFINASLYFELKTFLHGLFVVEDKISMAHSLETRVPFLDNDLVDFALNVPISHKLRQIAEMTARVDENDVGKRPHFRQKTDDGKIVLRKAMSRIIPAEITGRVKQGFSAPDASWFRGESIDYINRFLRDKRARLHELVNPRYITRILDEHCSGRVNHRLLIWSFLSLEWWLRTFFDSPHHDGFSPAAAR